MAIPAEMMPGAGGPPPAPMGAGMGGPPGGGGLDAILGMLAQMNQSPKQDAVDQMLEQASALINAAYTKVVPQSSKGAKNLAQANVNIQQCREALKQEATRPLPGPPDLSGGQGMSSPAAGPMMGL